MPDATPRLVEATPGASRRWPARLLLSLLALLASGPVAAAGDGIELGVVSYNVQFATPELVTPLLREWPGHKPNVTARAQAIGRRLACHDLIALQETVNASRRQELLAALEDHGRDCGPPSRLASGRMFATSHGPDRPAESLLPLVGGELTLASRWPILATSSTIYRDRVGEDRLVAKGVLHARLDLPGDAPLEVFVTHLQAGSNEAAVRAGQIGQLAAFIRATVTDRAAPVLVMGDLNLWGGTVDRGDPGSEYHLALAALGRAVAPRRLVDLWLATHPADPETDSGTKPRVLSDGTLRPREKRIDYILLAGDQARPLAMSRDFLDSDLVIDGRRLGPLSNHAALLATIGWLPGRLACCTTPAGL